MAWRGSNSPIDRISACLIYLLPLIESLSNGSYLFAQFPLLAQAILAPLSPFISLYGLITGAVPFGRLVIFFILLLAVVRNPRLSHFLRFNTMQAILLLIALSLVEIVFQLVGISLSVAPSSSNLLATMVANLMFLAFFPAAVYAIVQAALGRYPEIPVVSEAAYQQVRY